MAVVAENSKNNFTLKGTIFSSTETTAMGLGKRKKKVI